MPRKHGLRPYRVVKLSPDLLKLSSLVIDGGIEIHRAYGPGMFESAYSPCLAYELNVRGLKFEMKVPVPLFYKGLHIPRAYEADFIVEGCLVLELKAVDVLPKATKRQMGTYLRLLGCPLGLILNFGEETMKAGVHRVVNNFPFGTPPYAAVQIDIRDTPVTSVGPDK